MLPATRQELSQRLRAKERDISTWLIQGDAYRTYDLDFDHHFVEVFAEAGRWTVGKTESYSLQIGRWGYRFQNTSKGSQYTFLEHPLDPAKPWAVEIDIQAVDVNPASIFGILFGLNPATGDQYIFVVNPKERIFYISRHKGKTWKHLASREHTLAIEDWHFKLRVDQVEGYWQFFVDEWLVYCLPAESLPGLGFGPIISGQATIDISQLKVQW
jgi:hypothetical protein